MLKGLIFLNSGLNCSSLLILIFVTLYSKLISKINSALLRLKEGTYGFCEETGEPIGLKRLMARPVATLSIEAQEKHERDEKIFIDA